MSKSRMTVHVILFADIREYAVRIARDSDTETKKNFFLAFPLVVTNTGPGRFMVCVCILYDGSTKGSPKLVL